MNNVLTIGRLLTGLSKSLGIANQILPILKDYKPLVNNFKTIYNAVNKNNNNNNNEIINNKQVINNSIEKKVTNNKRTITNSDSPQFFI